MWGNSIGRVKESLHVFQDWVAEVLVRLHFEHGQDWCGGQA